MAPRQVVVLTPRSQQNSIFKEGENLGNGLRLTWKEAGERQVRIRHVHAFKGLEAPVVVLVEAEKVHAGPRNQILYVALSQASYHLIVIGPPPRPETAAEPVQFAKE